MSSLFQCFLASFVFYVNLAYANDFKDLNEYASFITGDGDITKIEHSIVGANIYAVTSWRTSDSEDGQFYGQDYIVLSVLKKKDKKIIEVVRTKALPQHMRLNFDSIENPRIRSFDIAFFQTSPLGRQTFHFIQRDNIWRLSGADCSSLYMNEDVGDEAIGDSGYEISINYLSGMAIETHYSGGKFQPNKKTKVSKKIKRLAEFEIGCSY